MFHLYTYDFLSINLQFYDEFTLNVLKMSKNLANSLKINEFNIKLSLND